jgi:hypothetical protein
MFTCSVVLFALTIYFQSNMSTFSDVYQPGKKTSAQSGKNAQVKSFLCHLKLSSSKYVTEVPRSCFLLSWVGTYVISVTFQDVISIPYWWDLRYLLMKENIKHICDSSVMLVLRSFGNICKINSKLDFPNNTHPKDFTLNKDDWQRLHKSPKKQSSAIHVASYCSLVLFG